MIDELKTAMRAIESAQDVPAGVSREHQWAALAGLGSKYLAIGSPQTIGLTNCGSAAPALYACHEILFGPLHIRIAGEHALHGHSDLLECSEEESLACDIVCLSTGEDVSLDWIADATHLNLVDSGPWSASMQSLAARMAVTWVGKPRHGLGLAHGSLADVITGAVSGRVAEEISCLLWTPEKNAG
jgi:hypothetical protein